MSNSSTAWIPDAANCKNSSDFSQLLKRYRIDIDASASNFSALVNYEIKRLGKPYILREIRKDLASLDFPAQLKEVGARLARIPIDHPTLRNNIEFDCLKLIEAEFDRTFNTKADHTRLAIASEGEVIPNPGIPAIQQSELDGQRNETDATDKFTRKQAIYLLQELIPEFKTADNTRKAEFIAKLTGYTSRKNIADEFSNIRNFADPALLEEWKEKFKKSGRGRKKNNP